MLPEGTWPWRYLFLYPLALAAIVFIFGLIAAIAIPSFVKARDTAQRNACINNLRMLDSAKEQAALKHGYNSGAKITSEDVSPFLPHGFDGLFCPKKGEYKIMPRGEAPLCTVHGDILGQAAQDSDKPPSSPEASD